MSKKKTPNTIIEVTPDQVNDIQKRMDKKGMSLYKLAKESGVTYQTLHDLMRMKKNTFQSKKLDAVEKVLQKK